MAAPESPSRAVAQATRMDVITPAEMALIGGDALRDRNAALKAKRQALEMDVPLDAVTILGGKVYINNKGLTIMLRRDERGPGSVAVEVVKDAWDDCILDTIRQRMGSTRREASARWADAGLMRAKCKARISFPDGSHYEAYGDASIITMGMPAMHNPDYSNHMAETRSVNRAIRRATGLDTTAEEMVAGVSRDAVTELGIDGAEMSATGDTPPPAAPLEDNAAQAKAARLAAYQELLALRPNTDARATLDYINAIADDVHMQRLVDGDGATPGYLRAMIDAVTQRAAQPTGPTRTVDMTTGEIIAHEGTAVSATGGAVAPETPSQPDASLPYVALRNKLDATAALEPAARNAQVDTLVGNARALLDGGEITAAEYEAVSVRAEAISPVAAIGDVPF